MRKIEREPNRIPAEPIMALVRGYLEETGDRFSEGSFTQASLFIFAERVDLKGDTLDHMMRGKQKTLDFDTADRMLCAMNLTDLWHTDLAEVYETAMLDEGMRRTKPLSASGERVCERVGCSNRFTPPRGRASRKRFCCQTCYSAWYHAERRGGYKVGAYGPGYSLSALVCRNGHQRTAENTKYNQFGRRYCVECKRATNRANGQRYRDMAIQAASG